MLRENRCDPFTFPFHQAIDLFKYVSPDHFDHLFEVAKRLQIMIYSSRALSRLKDISSYGLLEEIAKETPFDFVREWIRKAISTSTQSESGENFS